MFIFQKIAEDKIRDAFERGEFDRLEGRRKLSQKNNNSQQTEYEDLS
jgi:hypothetical protein